VNVDKKNLQHKQQRYHYHAWADFTPAAGTQLHHAVRNKAERDTFGN
jgi:hypothetical protein